MEERGGAVTGGPQRREESLERHAPTASPRAASHDHLQLIFLVARASEYRNIHGIGASAGGS